VAPITPRDCRPTRSNLSSTEAILGAGISEKASPLNIVLPWLQLYETGLAGLFSSLTVR
jgi:hypothetical protein